MSSRRNSGKSKPGYLGPLTIKLRDLQDWVQIEGTPQALSELATQILLVATGVEQHLTLDCPGPSLTSDSEIGLIVVKKTEQA